jgi:hypothetical protein
MQPVLKARRHSTSPALCSLYSFDIKKFTKLSGLDLFLKINFGGRWLEERISKFLSNCWAKTELILVGFDALKRIDREVPRNLLRAASRRERDRHGYKDVKAQPF